MFEQGDVGVVRTPSYSGRPWRCSPAGGAEVEGADDGRARGGDESREDGVEDVGEVGEDVGRG